MDDNNTACKILMTKTELRKSLDFVNEERERLQEELEDYKSRIEKAVEYIENNDLGVVKFYGRDVNGNLQQDIEKGYVKRQPLLDILNGRSDEINDNLFIY